MTQDHRRAAPALSSPHRAVGHQRLLAAKGTPRSAMRIVDIDIPMGSMIVFMLKWAIASIPAITHLRLRGRDAGRDLGRI